MAILRLQFELDSDIYPELYKALCAVRSTQAQTERVRQLAASGLVWENVRIFGAAAIGPNPAGSDLADSSAYAWQSSVSTPPTERKSKSKRPAEGITAKLRPKPSSELQGKSSAPRGDFVDLAISVTPHHELVPSDLDDNSHEAALNHVEVEQFARELPVLLDVVANEIESNDGAFTRTMPVYPVRPMVQAVPTDANEPQHIDRQIDAIQLVSLAQKPAMRSRLMRMKERGLFKNG